MFLGESLVEFVQADWNLVECGLHLLAAVSEVVDEFVESLLLQCFLHEVVDGVIASDAALVYLGHETFQELALVCPRARHEVGGGGTEAEGDFGADIVHGLLEVSCGGHLSVDEVFIGVAHLVALPYVGEGSLEGDFLVINGENQRHLVRNLTDNLVVFVVGLDVQCRSLCALAEEAIGDGVEDGRLAKSVAARNGGNVVSEVEFVLSDAAEVEEAKPLESDLLHTLYCLLR